MFMHISKGVSRVIFFPLFLRVRLTPKLLFLVLVSHTNNRLLHYYHAQNMVCLLHMSIINNNKSIRKIKIFCFRNYDAWPTCTFLRDTRYNGYSVNVVLHVYSEHLPCIGINILVGCIYEFTSLSMKLCVPFCLGRWVLLKLNAYVMQLITMSLRQQPLGCLLLEEGLSSW